MKLIILFIIALVIIYTAKDCTSSEKNKKEATATACSNKFKYSTLKHNHPHSLFFNHSFFTFTYSL